MLALFRFAIAESRRMQTKMREAHGGYADPELAMLDAVLDEHSSILRQNVAKMEQRLAGLVGPYAARTDADLRVVTDGRSRITEPRAALRELVAMHEGLVAQVGDALEVWKDDVFDEETSAVLFDVIVAHEAMLKLLHLFAVPAPQSRREAAGVQARALL